MYIFLYIFFLILYLLLCNNKNNNKSRKIYIIVVTIVLSLVSALRHNGVGIDTYSYYMSYINSQDLTWEYIGDNISSFFKGEMIKDPGYILLTKFLGLIIVDFNVYLFVVAFLFLSAIGYILYKSVGNLFGYVISYSYYLSLFYGFFPNSAIRQTIAMAILLWAIIIYNDKHRRILPLVFLIFASLIHKSVIFGLIPLFFLYFNNVKFVYKSAIIIMPLLFAINLEFVEILVLLSGAEHYMSYIEGKEGSSVIFIVEMVFFYVIGLLSLKYINRNSLYHKLALISFALAISIISFMRVNPSLQRLIAYFSIWGMVFIPNALYAHKSILKKIFIVCVLALCIGRSILIPNQYKFFWQQMELHERYGRVFR